MTAMSNALMGSEQSVVSEWNQTEGEAGYKESLPPSQGVSSGPKITAFHRIIFSELGDPFIPCGGSFCSLLKSRMSLCGKLLSRTMQGKIIPFVSMVHLNCKIHAISR